jgi:hypothetical protein
MSITPVGDVPAGASGPVRVRHQAREALAVMAFSATTSVALAAVLVMLAHWGR